MQLHVKKGSKLNLEFPKKIQVLRECLDLGANCYLCQKYIFIPILYGYTLFLMQGDLHDQEDLSRNLFDDKAHASFKWCSELIMVQSAPQEVGSHENEQSYFLPNDLFADNTQAINNDSCEGGKQLKKISQKTAFSIKGEMNVGKGLGCNCKKTLCLKSYCECYSKGMMCGQDCACLNCRNTEAHIQEIQNAKQKKYIKSSKLAHQCQCQKSKCLKKYCECFNSGYPCGIYCKCTDCANQKIEKDPEKISNNQTTAP